MSGLSLFRWSFQCNDAVPGGRWKTFALAGGLAASSVTSSAGILEQWLEDKNESRVHVDNGNVDNDTSTKRQGNVSFRSTLETSTNRRAELESRVRVPIGSTNWYGWAMKMDSAWPTGADTIINQFPTYPTNKNFWVNGASGNGSQIVIGRHGGDVLYGSDNRVSFILQHQGDADGIRVTVFDLGHVDKFKGQWFDFVIHVKWTGNNDGFLKLWYKPYWATDWGYPKIDYTGTTFWNDEDVAPYFKAGLYAGTPGPNPNARRRIWIDSYRHGDASSYLNQVKPQ